MLFRPFPEDLIAPLLQLLGTRHEWLKSLRAGLLPFELQHA
jgi:hypothetical protein